MNRLQIAVIILAALFLLTLAGGHLVSETLDSMQNMLVQVKALCQQGEYQAAQEQIQKLILTYQEKQTALIFFLRRDHLRELESGFHGLTAYAQAEYTQDLVYETEKLNAQINNIRQLFFGIL